MLNKRTISSDWNTRVRKISAPIQGVVEFPKIALSLILKVALKQAPKDVQ